MRAEAGLVTRLEAFLDEIDQSRCRVAPKVATARTSVPPAVASSATVVQLVNS